MPNLLHEIVLHDLTHDDVERYLRKRHDLWVEQPTNLPYEVDYKDATDSGEQSIRIIRDPGSSEYIWRLTLAIKKIAEREHRESLEVAIEISGGCVIRRTQTREAQVAGLVDMARHFTNLAATDPLEATIETSGSCKVRAITPSKEEVAKHAGAVLDEIKARTEVERYRISAEGMVSWSRLHVHKVTPVEWGIVVIGAAPQARELGKEIERMLGSYGIRASVVSQWVDW